eukprot:TRINITY_DN27233_c0_g1_i1.p1 TRINITY_DN27233_c0_g1~~TRINITY_DN27233_c0_g1_i1.p1  ORF type:complete len:1045 (+),score=220.44 TRINITY_DN27233_c0_g1_i1:59-3193(+)
MAYGDDVHGGFTKSINASFSAPSLQLPRSHVNTNSLADIQATLDQRLRKHPKGRILLKHRKLQEKQRPSLKHGGDHAPLSSAALARQQAAASRQQRRERLMSANSVSSSLPSLRHWADSPCAAEPPSPFVPPQCPHELLSKASRAQTAQSRQERMSNRSGTSSPRPLEDLDEDLIEEYDALSKIANEDFFPKILPDEPFVEKYLGELIPSSYPPSPRSPVTPFNPVAWNDTSDDFSLAPDSWKASPPQTAQSKKARLSSARSRTSVASYGSVFSSSSERAAVYQAKSYRQKILERFCTTKRAFDNFLAESGTGSKRRPSFLGDTDHLAIELDEDQFFSFCSKFMAGVPEQDYGKVFNFFDTDRSGTVSIAEFQRVVKAMLPVRCLQDLRCRWIALGFPSACKAMEHMAPRSTWPTARYSLEDFAELLKRVGIWESEEHEFLFRAVSTPILDDTVSIGELRAALCTVSPVLMIEDWGYRLSTMYENLDKAYDKIETTPLAVTDVNKFVVKVGENWKMPRHEAKRFFRLCDFDGKERISRLKFMAVMNLCKPSLQYEELRQKVRSHTLSVLHQMRRFNSHKTSLEGLDARILTTFTSCRADSGNLRAKTPDDFQRTYDEMKLTVKDADALFRLVDVKGSGTPTASAFLHMIKVFSPAIVMQDICMLCSIKAAADAATLREAQRLPLWQARQMRLNTTMSPELQAWSDARQDILSGTGNMLSKPGRVAKSMNAKLQASALAPIAAISSIFRPSSSSATMSMAGRSASERHEQRRVHLGIEKLEQVLKEVFSVSVDEDSPKVDFLGLMDILEDISPPNTLNMNQPAIGLTIAEFIAALGTVPAGDGARLDVSSEGREAKAQLEAKWLLAPFSDFAHELRDGVRERIRQKEKPRVLPAGSVYEPVSYIQTSSLPQIEKEEAADKDDEEDDSKPAKKPDNPLERKLVPLMLIKDLELRQDLKDKLTAEEADRPLPYLMRRRQKVIAAPSGPGDAFFKEMYDHIEKATDIYTPDDRMLANLQGYYAQAGDLVEDQKVMFSRKPRRPGPRKR